MAETREAPDRRLPEHVTTPLLTLITARSMDEDYAHVAQQRATAGEEPAQGGRPHWISLVAVAALGIMGAVVAAQTDREAEVDELSRAALVQQIESRRDEVRDLQRQVAELSRSNQSAASSPIIHAADRLIANPFWECGDPSPLWIELPRRFQSWLRVAERNRRPRLRTTRPGFQHRRGEAFGLNRISRFGGICGFRKRQLCECINPTRQRGVAVALADASG